MFEKSSQIMAALEGNTVLVKDDTEFDSGIADILGLTIIPPIIPVEASLKIYGISGFVPGDLIRISYLPKSYYNNIYFQVMKVSHDIGESWGTSLETVIGFLIA